MGKTRYKSRSLFHATPAQNVDEIMLCGIDPLAWLTTTREDACIIISDYKFESKPEEGSIRVFRVDLPRSWKLRKGPADEYISDTTIPPRYLRLML